MLPSLSRIGILIGFNISQDMILEFLCINRDVPESDCGGTCFLAEQLEKVESSSNQEVPTAQKDRYDTSIYSVVSLDLNLSPHSASCLATTAKNSEEYFAPQLGGVFRPPESVLS
jgi:hypothetical protein